MFSEYIKAFLLIFMAEMGDKTQILAMTFATRYPVRSVLTGVFIGALLNHGLAIALGSLLTRLVPVFYFQVAAGAAFCLFGLMSLRAEDGEEENPSPIKTLGPVLTVALAFFIGELGDKTQLAAVTLSVSSDHPLVILMGTVTGMVLVSLVGIWVGVKLGDRIPEPYMKLAASLLFTLFGVLKLYEALPGGRWLPVVFVLLYAGAVLRFVRSDAFRAFREGRRISSFGKTARLLYAYQNRMLPNIEDLCLGEKRCEACQGDRCIIGYARRLLENARDEKSLEGLGKWTGSLKSLEKAFDGDKVLESYRSTLEILSLHPELLAPDNLINRVRNALEWILFGEPLFFDGEMDALFEQIRQKDLEVWEKLKDGINK